MSRPDPTPAPVAVRAFDLNTIGASLTAIRSLTAGSSGLDEENARAVYQLAVLALVEWRLLDEADDRLELRP